MEYFTFLYLTASGLLIAALLFLVIRWPLGVHKTFSMHAAQSERLILYYVAVFSLLMPLMAASITAFAYFKELSYLAPTLFGIATIAQIICTIFPENESWRSMMIHRSFAGVSAALLLLCLITFIPQISGTDQTYAIIGGAVMGVCALIALFSKGRFALVLQSAFYLAFLIPTALLFVS